MASPVVFRGDSSEAGDTGLTIQFAVGATGAVGAIQGPGNSRQKEFRRATPILRISAGIYDIFLREAWLALLDCHGFVTGNGVAFAASDGWNGVLITDNVGT